MNERESIKILLKDHGQRGGFLYGGGITRDNPGQWSCACGAKGVLGPGETILGAWREHLAEVLDNYFTWRLKVELAGGLTDG